MPNLPHGGGGSSKPVIMFGTEGTTGTLTSPSNQLVSIFKTVNERAQINMN